MSKKWNILFSRKKIEDAYYGVTPFYFYLDRSNGTSELEEKVYSFSIVLNDTVDNLIVFTTLQAIDSGTVKNFV